MKTLRIPQIFLISQLLLFNAYGQNVEWAQKGISRGFDFGNAITCDETGNVYVAGQIEYTTQFDGLSLSSYGIHDIFAGKFGPDGSIKWLHHACWPPL